MRRELHLRFEDEEFDNPQGASELLSELVIDPKEQSAFPLFFQRLSNDAKKKAVSAGRRVPSRSEGTALPCPLHTSRGVTNSKETETQIFQISPSTSGASRSSIVNSSRWDAGNRSVRA